MRVRWGLGDFFAVYLVAILLAAPLAQGIALGVTGDPLDDPGAAVVAATFAAQFGAFFVGVWLVSRAKGSGSLRHDFGFGVSTSDWWVPLLGMGLFVVSILFVLPLVSLAGNENQQVVEDLMDAGGVELAVYLVAAGLLAPVLEELLFRGLLLRALVRRLDPLYAVAVCGLLFGAVHLTDFSIGSVARLPALVLLGTFSSVLAVRSGGLSQPILLHLGFNLVTVLSVLAS